MVALPKMNPAPVSDKPINTHGLVCDFGKHAGTLYTRIPVSYLQWMINADHPKADIARAEVKRRNTVVPDMDISGHAIDGASTRCLKTWDETRLIAEGLHAWLVRQTKAAIEANNVDEHGRLHHLGLVFVVARDGEWPVLQTIFPERKSSKVDWPAPMRRRLEGLANAKATYAKSKGNW